MSKIETDQISFHDNYAAAVRLFREEAIECARIDAFLELAKAYCLGAGVPKTNVQLAKRLLREVPLVHLGYSELENVYGLDDFKCKD